MPTRNAKKQTPPHNRLVLNPAFRLLWNAIQLHGMRRFATDCLLHDRHELDAFNPDGKLPFVWGLNRDPGATFIHGRWKSRDSDTWGPQAWDWTRMVERSYPDTRWYAYCGETLVEMDRGELDTFCHEGPCSLRGCPSGVRDPRSEYPRP